MRLRVADVFLRSRIGSAEERESQEEERARVRDLVSRPGYEEDLLRWVQRELKRVKIQPAGEKEMLYQIGYRDGIEYVEQRLLALREAGRD